MARKEQLEALQAGDVVYVRGQRYTFERFNTQTNNGMGTVTWLVLIHRQGFVESMSMSWATAEVSRIVPVAKQRKPSKRRIENFSKLSVRDAFPDRPYTESNDCAVISLALLLNVPYSVAHARLGALGRKHGKGTVTAILYPQCGLKYVSCYNQTLGKLLKSGTLPARCIVNVHAHVFAVIDGKVTDHTQHGSRLRVRGYYVVNMQA